MATLAKRTFDQKVTVDEVKRLFEEKMQSDPEFKEEFQGKVDMYVDLAVLIINNFSSYEEFCWVMDEYHRMKRGETHEQNHA